MLKSIVKVIENSKTGQVVTLNKITDSDGKKREIGTVMVQSSSPSGLSRIGRLSTRTAFITLEKELMDYYEGSLIHNQEFPTQGKIVINETLVPYIYKSGEKKGQKQEAKTRGKGGAVITHNGKPVYRNSYFTTNMAEQDVLLTSDPVLGSDEQSAMQE